jgi:hypothetical protein
MKRKEKLFIISNDKIYNKHYLNHNDLNSIALSFNKYFDLKIICRYTKNKYAFRAEKNIKFLNFFSLRNILKINKDLKNSKLLFISITPFNFFFFCFCKIFFFKKNYRSYLYLRSNGFLEYRYIFGFFGKIIYYIMHRLMSANSMVVASSSDLVKNLKTYSILRPSELDSSWFIKRKKTNSSYINLLYLGRLRKEKGIYNLIFLLKKIKINYKLTVVGLEAGKYNYQEGRISYYLQEFKKNKIIEYYDKSNIFILPSYTESAPKVIWESLARLRPVIVFHDIMHVSQKKIGVYVSKRNSTSLAKTVNFIIRNYKSIQSQIKKNNFPLKNQFQKDFLNILKKK